MYLHVAVCEDDSYALNLIVKKIRDCFRERNVSINITAYTNGKELLEQLTQNTFHVFFLDIDLPLINGIHIGKKIHCNHNYQETPIVFISSRNEMVYQSIQARPFRFIRKTMLDQELPETIDAIITYFNENHHSVFSFEENHTFYSVPVRNILYIESFRKQLCIHCPERTYQTQMKLSDAAAQLSNFGFIQSHKSYLINYRAICCVGINEVILDNQEQIPLSRHRLNSFKTQYMLLLQKNDFIERI